MARRAISLAGIAALYAENTGDGLLPLIKLSHESLSPSLRYVRNTDGIFSRGNEYDALAFDILFPSETEQSPPVARMTVDNVGRTLIPLLRSVTTFVSVDIELVKISDLDLVEARWLNYRITQVTGPDAVSVDTKLELDDLTVARYPRFHYTESLYPALWRAS
jgi:hypothetical protein